MARSVEVDETIPCPFIGSGEATQRLLSIASENYKTVSASSDRLQFARTFRPLWALIVGIALLPVLVGVIFLFIRSTETWAATIETDHRSARVRVSGKVLPSTLVGVHDAMAASVSMAAPAAGGLVFDAIMTPGMMPTPATDGRDSNDALTHGAQFSGGTLGGGPLSGGASTAATSGTEEYPWLAPTEAIDGGTAPSETVMAPPRSPEPQGPLTSSATSSPRVGQSSDTESDDEPTLLRRRLPSERLPVDTGAPLARFDTGERQLIERKVVVGRDPQVGQGDQEVIVVAIADPDMSVSKTHLSLDRLGGDAVVTDLGSTNGTTITMQDGSSTELVPHQRVVVSPGTTINFGRRSFTIESGESVR